MVRQLIAGIATVLVLSAPTQAAITLNLDEFTFSDSETGLEWLQLTRTVDITYSDMTSLLGPGQLFAGWRHATPEEVYDLYASLGLLPPEGRGDVTEADDPVTYHAARSAMELLGVTYYAPLLGYMEHVGGRMQSGTLGFVQHFTDATGLGSPSFVRWGFFPASPQDGFGGAGHFLVRDVAAVPEPAEWALMCAGLGLIGWVARRRRPQSSSAPV